MARKIWVVKAGSQLVCEGGLDLVRHWMSQVQALRSKKAIDAVWVTSGAIATAADKLDLASTKKTLPEKQALSAIGQPLVMDLYNKALTELGLKGAQVLLTAEDIRRPNSRKNLINTLTKLLSWSALPVINENDAVATAEIQFGDNDTLSAQIAKLIKADRLVLMTDVEGLYEDDPKRNKHAKFISWLPRVPDSLLKATEKAMKSERGTGGMYSKLLAARLATQAKTTAHLVRGSFENSLIRLADGEALGTQIGGKHV